MECVFFALLLFQLAYSQPCGIVDGDCAAALQEQKWQLQILALVSCLNESRLCDVELVGQSVYMNCEMFPERYTMFTSPDKCTAAQKARSNCASLLPPCASTVQMAADSFECGFTPPLIGSALLAVVAILGLVGLCFVRVSARVHRLAGSDGSGCLQKLDLIVRKWQNLIWRILKLKSRRPWGMVIEQLLPLLLSTFFIVAVNLDGPVDLAVVYQTWARGYWVSFNMDWGSVQPSVTTQDIMQQLTVLMPLFFTLCYAKFVSSMTGDLVRDKESRVSELLKIMGTSNTSLNGSWFCCQMLLGLPLAIAMSIALTVGNVFPAANLGSLILFFYVFYLNIVAFAQACAPFFTTSRAASWVSVLIWMLFHVLAYQAQQAPVSQQRQWIWLPQVAFFLGVSRLASVAVLPAIPQCETNFYGYLTLEACTAYMGINTVIFMFLGWYLSRVIPQQYGSPLAWYFCCRRDYWAPRRRWKRQLSLQQQLKRTFVEDDDLSFTADGVSIQGLCKDFKLKDGEIKKAVIDMRLTLPRDSITVLLGHNGAGKTTTIDMLTGLLVPTAGTAKVLGLDLREDMDEIRSKMGVCLQYDVLFERLSVLDHLVFFAVAKGTPPEQAEKQAKTMGQEVGLAEKLSARAGSLSGGQKRKLSLAIALIGSSEVVFLDEPTSGMDPHSRRCTWDFIRRYRAGRVIILTTHFMDEADILGDMIAVMADGQLQCAGSSLFLKHRYGCGYSLSMTTSSAPERVLSFVRGYVSEAKIQSSAGSELLVQLPTEASASFPVLLRALDVQKKALGVEEFGLSLTTLEDVFLKIAADTNHFTASRIQSRPTVSGRGGRCPRQFCALLAKRFLYARRDWQVAGLGLFLPLLFLLGLFLMPAFNIASLGLLPYYRNATVQNLTSAEFLSCLHKQPCQTDFSAPVDFAQCFGIMSTCSCSLDRLSGCACTNGCSVDSTRHDPCQTPYCPSRTKSNDCFNLNCMRKRDLKWQTILNVFLAALTTTLALTFVSVAMIVYVVREQEPQQNARLQQLISGAHPLAYWASLFCFDLLVAAVPSVASLFAIFNFLTKATMLHTSEQTIAILALLLLYTVIHIPFTYIFSFRYEHHSKAQTGILVFGLLSGPLLAICAEILKIIHYKHISKIAGTYLVWIFLAFPGFALCDGIYHISLLRHGTPLGYFGDGIGSSSASVDQVLLYPYCFAPPMGGQITTDQDLSCWARAGQSCCIPPVLGWYVVGRNLAYLAAEGLLSLIFLWIMDARQRRGIQGCCCCSLRCCRRARVSPQKEDEEDDDVTAERQRVESGRADKDTIVIRNLSKSYGGDKISLHGLCLGVGDGCFGYLGVNGAGKTTTIKILTGCIRPSGGTATLGGFDVLREQLQARTIMGYCPQFDALLDFLTVREHLILFAHLKGLPRETVTEEVDYFLERMGLDTFSNKMSYTLSAGNKRKLSAALALLGRPRVIFLDEPSSGMDPAARRFMWDLIRDTAAGGCSVLLTTHSMEECEALCSRIGVLVAGRLVCLGSAQRLKAKFGTGYRVEGRLRRTSSEAVLSQMTGIESITPDQIFPLCQRLGEPRWAERVVETHPSGWLLAHMMEERGLSPQAFADWWVLEQAFDGVVKYLVDQFGQVEVCERHGVHFALSVKGGASVASVFEQMHKLQTGGNVEDFSVSQTTLEEIFNAFAGNEKGE